MIVLNEDAKPKITDYKVWNDAGDYTEETFKGKKLFLIIKNLSDINTAALPDMNKLINNVRTKGIEPVILTSGNSAEIEKFLSEHQLVAPYYYVDATVLKTISRSNPGLWLLKDGTVKGKWHYNDTPTAEEVIALAK
jgi:phosphoglycolate phosphatase-like HAD superfamily hydrolase